MTFEEIYLEAVNHGCPASNANDVEYEIGLYLLDKLEKGEIDDPILIEKLLWLKAYLILFDIEYN